MLKMLININTSSIVMLRGPKNRYCHFLGIIVSSAQIFINASEVCSRVGRKWKNLSDFLCHGDVNIGYRIIPTSEIASLLRCVL